MKLVKVEFTNYKSISGDILELEKDITCLVGINEAGKSNVLLALDKVDKEKQLMAAEYSRHSKGYGDSGSSPELKLWLEPIDSEIQALKNLLGIDDVSTIVLTKSISSYQLDYPIIDFKKSSYYQPPEAKVQTATEPPTTENTAESADPINDQVRSEIREKVISELTQTYLPRFLRFDSVIFTEYFLPLNGEVSINNLISDPNTLKPVRNLLILGGLTDLNKLLAPDENERLRRDKLLGDISQKINDEILRVVWPVESVEVHLDAEGDILKIRLKEKNKTTPFKPDERSRGLQWALAFNIYFLAESQGVLKNSVLLIDEPGIFLHIDAQNKLLDKTFPDIVKKGNQIVYTTHLPYLIDSKYPERIRILEKDNEDTIIGNKAWSEGEFGKIPEPVRTALGLRWSELFNLGENNVIVEGPSDQIILRTLSSLLGTLKDINFLPAYGYKKFPPILAIVKIEEKKRFGLIDGDADKGTLRKKCRAISIKKDEIEALPVLVGNQAVITIEDILPSTVFKQAIYDVYKPISDRRKNCSLTLDEIPDTYPRVKSIEEFFKNKFKLTRHKLLKMEVARSAAEILLKLDITKSSDELLIGKTLISEIENKFVNKVKN